MPSARSSLQSALLELGIESPLATEAVPHVRDFVNQPLPVTVMPPKNTPKAKSAPPQKNLFECDLSKFPNPLPCYIMQKNRVRELQDDPTLASLDQMTETLRQTAEQSMVARYAGDATRVSPIKARPISEPVPEVKFDLDPNLDGKTVFDKALNKNVSSAKSVVPPKPQPKSKSTKSSPMSWFRSVAPPVPNKPATLSK